MKQTLNETLVCVIALACILSGCAKSVGDDTVPADSNETLIVGGQNVTKKDDIANVTVSLLDRRQGTLCTASLLSESIAISAAHCVSGNPQDMQLSFGSRSAKGVLRQVVRFATTPAWSKRQNHATDTGDISVIQFSGGLPQSFHSVALMNSKHRFKNGETVTLAGFGISNGETDKGAGTLRYVDVKIANAHFSKTEISLDQTENRGACHGDSGGPAFVEESNGELTLWGVTSRGIQDANDQCNGGSVYTRIQPYVHWINSTIASW